MPVPETIEQSFPLYGRPGRFDPAHDALLSTGFLGDGDVDVLLGATRPVAGLGEDGPVGRLTRKGKWVWVTWSAAGEDGVFVAAHGLSDREVIAAARATVVDPEGLVGPSDREEGTALRIRASGERTDRSRLRAVGRRAGDAREGATGSRLISTRVMTAGRGAEALVRFWAKQRAFAVSDPGSDQEVVTRAAVARVATR